MPTTRKKVLKTVYKDDDDSEAEKYAGDFSDSGSEAEIVAESSSEDSEDGESSADDFDNEKSKKKLPRSRPVRRKPKFAKEFVSKINRQTLAGSDNEVDVAPIPFTVKDLTDADKILPSFLNLSESDTSEDESPRSPKKLTSNVPISAVQDKVSDSEDETKQEYKDVWSQNVDNSEEVAKKTFMELEQHKAQIEETKASILNYTAKLDSKTDLDVKDLLAQGEEIISQSQTSPSVKRSRAKKPKDDSDSEMEDWEEVKEAKGIPQQGLQLVVGIPDNICRRTKKLDIEMMMKRKINKVKKENQVYMHKVHVLCWLGHGNYVSRVLNDQEVLAAALSLVPGKECYPGERVDMKYVEQITTWYKDKFTLKVDKNEDKFRPKAPPLKEILISQIKKRVVTSKKYLVFIFVSMLRALGLRSRVMFNFVTLPLRPPSSELCSLSTKQKEDKEPANTQKKDVKTKETKRKISTDKTKGKIPQVDGMYDEIENDVDNITQLDGNDDAVLEKARTTRTKRATKNSKITTEENEDVSPPKRARHCPTPKSKNATSVSKEVNKSNELDADVPQSKKTRKRKSQEEPKSVNGSDENTGEKSCKSSPSPPRKVTTDKSNDKSNKSAKMATKDIIDKKNLRKTRSRQIKEERANEVTKSPNPPNIVITDENSVQSKYFGSEKSVSMKKLSLSRKRSQTVDSSISENKFKPKQLEVPETSKTKPRTRSAPENPVEKSKYFDSSDIGKSRNVKKPRLTKQMKQEVAEEDAQRVCHRDLQRSKPKSKNDVTDDLIGIIKKRVRKAKAEAVRGKVKSKIKNEADEDSDYLPEEAPKRRDSESDDDFKPTKISPRPSTSRKIDRRVLSSDDDTLKNKTDVWCEIYVEELEQWISVDVVKGKAHCTNEIYSHATHPVCYVVGWDNNNYLKDLTRRYVPHFNTVTRKQRAEPAWWDPAIRPWLGPKTARDKEEDEQLNRMQLEAPLPKSVAEYKNHPLYALKRHLLKFEAIYPPDAATLGFVRNEPVYARECVYVCRSRDTWLKEAKVVRLGEKPYKIVKARPKWDKLSNKIGDGGSLELFGPWQTQDYEPPVAENGIVPRNAYGNVELFKECMLPKGTAHVKLPGLNRIAKKLNIDCAPAMTGFDFNGGWSHPVYDGFVVCQEFAEIITEAWLKDQEEQVRKEREKIDARVYGNWKRLIKGLLIKERLKNKYGFEEPSTSQDKKTKGPRLIVKKK